MKRLSKKFEDIMAAVAFAEAGEAETARQIMKESRLGKEVKLTKSKRERAKTLSEAHDKTMEAITFAEAGEHEYARALIKERESERKKILVVGSEEGFSEKLITYALGMAERMNYEIVALNVISVGKRLYSFLNDNVREEIQSEIEKGAETFKETAVEKNIPFSHMTKFGDVDKSIREAHKEVRRISFIVTEPEYISGKKSAKGNIPVFSLADA